MKGIHSIFAGLAMVACLAASHEAAAQPKAGTSPSNGDVVDRFNGIPVYFNSPISHSSGRNVAPDGYYYGMRYQCVEFVKRYYYQRFRHRMPKVTGNGADYFDKGTADGALNAQRGLLQYRNGSETAPQVEDILVFGARPGNPYGHVAIVSAVSDASLEIIQQNPGPSGHSRRSLRLNRSDGGVRVENPRVLGWLRLPGRTPPPVAAAPPPLGQTPAQSVGSEKPSAEADAPSAKSP